jgi:hypothetical protein
LPIDDLPFYEAAGLFVSMINVNKDEKVIANTIISEPVQGRDIPPRLSFLSSATWSFSANVPAATAATRRKFPPMYHQSKRRSCNFSS